MNEDIIAMLNEDIDGEHAAIIQYLEHAYGMGEGEIACEIEAIAREEMRHLDWLAETTVRLEGAPSLQRGPMRRGGAAAADWLKNDVLAEEEGQATPLVGRLPLSVNRTSLALCATHRRLTLPVLETGGITEQG